MGERASVGKLVFNVTDTEWKATVGESAKARIPEHRFLIVKLSVTNSGSQQAGVPLLNVYNAEGKAFRESDNGDGINNWMGLLRLVKPAETLQGAILFDVPLASYKLQITDGGEPDNEIIAYVDLPLNLETDPILAEPPAIPSLTQPSVEPPKK